MLFGKDGPLENIVVRGARAVDPVEGVDAVLDVRIDNGVIAALGTDLDTNSHRIVEGSGLLLAPAFVDPHVHLRTPGRRTRRRSRPRLLLPRRGRRLLRRRRDAEHRSRRGLCGHARLARRGGARRRGDPGRLPRGDHEGPGGNGAD